jgi:Cu(I)/Ag(I) efflux system membrane fusion protein/cobalt-zinc-cadmium efflux system membrane fusion protein
MKNIIIVYSLLIVLGILIGVGATYYLSTEEATNAHEHESDETLYTCGMHPNIIEEEPGTCPICGMNLTPIKGSSKGKKKSSGERKIIYWRAPMNPNEIYDDPGKSKMGMDLVPVYEDEGSAHGVVTIDGSVLQNMNIKTEIVKSKNLSSDIYTNGVLTTDERKVFKVTTKISGWVEKLYVNYVGQKVKKGQKLVDIYSPELVATQQELISAFEMKDKMQNFSSDAILINSINKLKLFDISQEVIDKIISTKKVEKYLPLYAPFNGTVLTKNVIEGEKINQGSELMMMADLSNLWLKADIYESEIGSCKLGATAEITFPFNPGKTYQGKVSFIYPTLDTKTRTASVRIDIKNNNAELKPAMYGTVEIKGEGGEILPVLPETAVLRNGKNNMVVVYLGEGQFKPVEVKLGKYSSGFYEVMSGVKLGDEIVTSGQFMIDSESSLRSAVNLFSSNKGDSDKSKMGVYETKDENKIKELNAHQHNKTDSIVREGIVDLEAIDKNNDGKVFQDPMDWNVISDEAGRCSLCNMFLNEVTIEEAKKNLTDNGFEYK